MDQIFSALQAGQKEGHAWISITRQGIAWVTALLIMLILNGCVPVKRQITASVLDDLRVGNCAQARKNITKESDSQLLNAMELGSVNYICQDYQASLEQFLRARQIGEELYTRHLSDTALDLVGFSKPYPGTAQELPYIDYYRSLAYLSQANQAKDAYQRQDLIDASVVEVRNLNIRLQEMAVKRFYREADSQNQNPLVAVLANIFSAVYSYDLNQKPSLTGDNAWLHYFSALMYEKKGELDNARIQYKKATDLYIKTYYRNYGKQRTQLSINEARRDTVTLLRQEKRSESEIRKLLKRKSLPVSRKGKHQLAVIQNVGLTAPMGQLNLILRSIPSLKTLVLAPVPVGNVREREDQLRWFSLMSEYKKNKDNYKKLRKKLGNGLLDKVRMIPLVGVWEQARKAGVIRGIGPGLKLSIPYYSIRDSDLGKSVLYLDGRKVADFVTMEPVSEVAIQEQLRLSNNQLFETLVKQVFKAAGVNHMVDDKGKQKQDDNPFSLGNLFADLTMSADTRKWRFLPEEIRLARVPLKAGSHKLKVVTELEGGRKISSAEIPVNAEDPISIVPVTTLTSVQAVNNQRAPKRRATRPAWLPNLGKAASKSFSDLTK